MRRTKFLFVCEDLDAQLSECLEWGQVLKDEIGKDVRTFVPERRVETKNAILDFVSYKPLYCGRYDYIIPENCSPEKVIEIIVG